MLNNKSIAVVVPCYNEASQIAHVIETMPDFVDKIVVVNDCSCDRTAEVVRSYIVSQGVRPLPEREAKIRHSLYARADQVVAEMNREEIRYFVPSEVVNADQSADRLILINHLENGGVGASIARGYKWCKDHHIDCTAVMAGDGQMDPDELISICAPVVEEGIDYVKGNRLIHRSAWLVIPKMRFFGNSIMSIMTKVASGYWHISDTQTGYTAISFAALNALRLYDIYRSYGMPNDMLVKLNIAFCTIREVPIKPVYDVGEKSKMKIMKVIPRVSWLLFRSFFKRLWVKYLFKDFHPLFLLYHFGFFLFAMNCIYILRILDPIYISKGEMIPERDLIKFIFFSISSFQSFMFAMWMDIQDNQRLEK